MIKKIEHLGGHLLLRESLLQGQQLPLLLMITNLTAGIHPRGNSRSDKMVYILVDPPVETVKHLLPYRRQGLQVPCPT